MEERIESLEDRLSHLEKSGGLSKADKDFLALDQTLRKNLRRITEVVLEHVYKIFIERHPELKSLRYNIYELADREKPIISKLDIGRFLERLSPRQRRTFRGISLSVSEVLINGENQTK